MGIAANMPRLGVLLLAIAHASCMEMRETVERMVMVRTTGSDLQPAATGYIYKKEDDGPERLVKMKEDEVMEHLSKIYKQPESFAAPIPAAAGPFYGKEDEQKSASYTKEHVIPVEEKDEKTDNEEHDDGAAEVDYDKILRNYGFGKYNDDFADYLRELGYFQDGLHHEKDEGEHHGTKDHHDHGDKGYKGYATDHHYNNGGTGDYHTEKYERYSVSKKGGHKKDYGDADAHGKHYAKGGGYKGGDHGYKSGHSKGEAVDGFHKLYDKDEYKKDNDFHDTAKKEGDFHKHADGHEYHGSDAAGHKEGGTHESEHDKGDFGKGGYVEQESGDDHGKGHGKEENGESSHHHKGEFGVEGSKFGSKNYDYQVKH